MAEKVVSFEVDASESRPKIQVISRASQILRALENEPEGLSLGKIAKKVGLARSTVQRIVNALEQEGFLVGSSAGGGVRLGPALLRLGAAAQAEQMQIVRPHIAALSARINETVDISILSGSYAVFVDQIVGQNALRAVSSIGVAMPLWNTAHGKAMLATMSDAEIKQHFDFLMGNSREGKRPSFRKLSREIDEIRECGVGFALDEFTEGISAIGSVIGHLSSNLAAISVPVPTQRFKGREKWLTDCLLETVNEIKGNIG